jgi:hypothetical protein
MKVGFHADALDPDACSEQVYSKEEQPSNEDRLDKFPQKTPETCASRDMRFTPLWGRWCIKRSFVHSR